MVLVPRNDHIATICCRTDQLNGIFEIRMIHLKSLIHDPVRDGSNFEKSFSAYADYDSTNSLDAVESSLCEEIVDKLVEDMFNASVAQW